MKLSRFLLAGLTAATLSTSVYSSAFAGNDAIVIQNGVYNSVSASQQGRSNDIVVEQYGYENQASVRQTGRDNGAAVLQDGVFNSIQLVQRKRERLFRRHW